jgi:transcriptional repressor NrdR
MKCPVCGINNDKVVDTREAKDGDSVRRRRECLNCRHRFTTYESVLRAELMVVKRDGTREEFSPAKLRSGIVRACWKRPVSDRQISELIKTITGRVDALQEREISTGKVGQFVIEGLREIDEVAFVRFASVYRRFADVGEFINEIRNLSDGD